MEVLFLACLLVAVPILASGSPVTASKVGIALYYESMCGGCRQFIQDQFYPTYQKVGEIMNVTLVPYGNAEESRYGDQWKFSCQHGPEECVGNLIETCAISILRNVSVYFPFIYCLEMNIGYSPLPAAERCASQLGIDFAPINKCQSGPEGNALEHAMAQKTNSLYPRHQYVPWITLNGKHTNEIQNEATYNLLQLVCKTYQGPKPSACPQSWPDDKTGGVKVRNGDNIAIARNYIDGMGILLYSHGTGAAAVRFPGLENVVVCGNHLVVRNTQSTAAVIRYLEHLSHSIDQPDENLVYSGSEFEIIGLSDPTNVMCIYLGKVRTDLNEHHMYSDNVYYGYTPTTTVRIRGREESLHSTQLM